MFVTTDLFHLRKRDQVLVQWHKADLSHSTSKDLYLSLIFHFIASKSPKIACPAKNEYGHKMCYQKHAQLSFKTGT